VVIYMTCHYLGSREEGKNRDTWPWKLSTRHVTPKRCTELPKLCMHMAILIESKKNQTAMVK
jgi:hypothetical protein